MRQEFIDGTKLKEMLYSAARLLDINKQKINSLNVFPVPDGDTGTNMCLTMMSAIKEIQALQNGNVSQVAEALSRGSLKGARGNSGVILSQLFRGFARGLKGEQNITTQKYAEALQAGVDTSYKAVMKPVEGTILTVARVTTEEAVKIARTYSDFNIFFREIIKVAKNTLDKTPDMLHVLKQAGVVDAGGMGLLYIMIGMANALKEDFDVDLSMLTGEIAEQSKPDFYDKGLDEIERGYCTEFFIKNLFAHIREEDIEKLQYKLDKLGDSLVIVNDDDIIKVHIHTNMPGKILQLGLRFGELSGIKIDNMHEQHRHMNEMSVNKSDKNPRKKYGLISVAAGLGISSIFKDLGVDCIIEGGQTMNPSIEDLLKGVDSVDAEQVFILPNNSNIILSASQVQQISKRTVHVIPSKSIPQGISSMVAFNPDAEPDVNITRMVGALAAVKTGLVTCAVRDSNFDGMAIKNGDILGIAEADIRVVGKDVVQVTQDLIAYMLDGKSEILSLFYGKDVPKQTADSLAELIESDYPEMDVEVHSGGQPLYYYLISLE